MSLVSFKEAIMLLLGIGLIYSLFYLRTHEDVFSNGKVILTEAAVSEETVLKDTHKQPQPKVLPPAVIEQVQIPDWLSNKDDFDVSNLTAEDLLELARISHEQDHDFFPENQNTLVYLLKAKELGLVSDEIEELLTTIHASLYTQAEQAIMAYDANTLIALTARLKSIDDKDPKIKEYTDKISLFYTLKRLTQETQTHIQNGVLYETDQNDAIHTLLVALELDSNYQPLIDLKEHLINAISQIALRAAQEHDFIIADQNITILNEIDANHPTTTFTTNQIESLKQNRFAYLDQQFFAAINTLNMSRAQDMIDELSDLEVAKDQIAGYVALYHKTKTYGPYELQDEFNDLLSNGQPGPSMVVMPTGSYFMGSKTGPKHQRPRHLVQIEYGFAVSQTEITVRQFRQFIEASNYETTSEQKNRTKIYDERTGRFKDKFNINWQHDYLGKIADDDLPVIHISWDDAKAYAEWLNSNTGEDYRLLSESEFEYILSANSETIYPWGNQFPTQVWGNFSGAKDKFKRSRIRWREGFAEYEDGFWGPAPVGSFIKNLFGLHDLSGNVMEWVDDCWHDTYTRAPTNGTSWINRGCENRVIRGGSWGSAIEEYQIHHRVKAKSNFTDSRLGFRVAKTLSY